jgi:hypothetical protein
MGLPVCGKANVQLLAKRARDCMAAIEDDDRVRDVLAFQLSRAGVTVWPSASAACPLGRKWPETLQMTHSAPTAQC